VDIIFGEFAEYVVLQHQKLIFKNLKVNDMQIRLNKAVFDNAI